MDATISSRHACCRSDDPGRDAVNLYHIPGVGNGQRLGVRPGLDGLVGTHMGIT